MDEPVHHDSTITTEGTTDAMEGDIIPDGTITMESTADATGDPVIPSDKIVLDEGTGIPRKVQSSLAVLSLLLVPLMIHLILMLLLQLKALVPVDGVDCSKLDAKRLVCGVVEVTPENQSRLAHKAGILDPVLLHQDVAHDEHLNPILYGLEESRHCTDDRTVRYSAMAGCN
jgi:hypothetical protein